MRNGSSPKALQRQEALQEETRSTATMHRVPWSNDEVELLHSHLWAHGGVLSTEVAVALAKELGRTYGSLIRKASLLRNQPGVGSTAEPVELTEEELDSVGVYLGWKNRRKSLEQGDGE